ncbi:MAG: hypothetical protein FWE33_07025 [Defluviitaleaceae bacterium]|nr:hypothetical protein [Defluviitaleaceae bacterium]
MYFYNKPKAARNVRLLLSCCYDVIFAYFYVLKEIILNKIIPQPTIFCINFYRD